ncbi:hypothetical protein QQ045_018684 [Rhodiola kirilowii]
MVYSEGRGRMKVLARLLDAGSFTKIVLPDDGKKQKLGAADIHRELSDADDANLLDEEDMHVFGRNPMHDPLYLVSCNFCKKTINACQYASHAELCIFLGFQKAYTEVDDCSRHKKTTHTKRIKVSRFPPDRAMTPGVRTKLESTTVDDSVPSKSYQDEHIGTVSSLSTLTDDSLDGMPKVDVSSINFGFEGLSTAAVCHLKRCKLMDARIMVKSGEQETRDTKLCRCEDGQTCNHILHSDRGSSEAATAGYGMPHKKPLDHQKTDNFSNCGLLNDIPAPLATKMYYSQQSNHLRSALALMFHKVSEIRSSSDVVSTEAVEGNLTSPDTCPTLDEHGNEVSDTKESCYQGSVCRPASGFQRVADSRPTAQISSLTAKNLLRLHTATSNGLLNR